MTPQHHLPADIERTSISIITRELALPTIYATMGMQKGDNT